MIRYVVAILLTIAIVSIAAPAVDQAAIASSERVLSTNAAEIDRAATSLVKSEDVPPDGYPAPRRIVTVSLPAETETSVSVSRFEIERVTDAHTAITYRVSGGETHVVTVDAPIVHATPRENRSLELGGSGVKSLVFTLEVDQRGDPVVVVTRDSASDRTVRTTAIVPSLAGVGFSLTAL